MRVGFFGGSFDPPHVGHLAVARAAANAFHLRKVLLAPAGVQPLKRHGPEASYADRLEMVRLLCKDVPELDASAVDEPREGGEPNYTIDALERLGRTCPAMTELYVIAGVDAFNTLRQWRDFGKLFEVAHWIVVDRPRCSVAWEDLQLTPEQRARVHVLDGVEEPASATLVREQLHRGRNCDELLTPKVLDYIRAHHLYGT